MEKPDVDSIEGLSPAVAIQQRGVRHNPRSTVATITEIYDYLRLLYARIGTPYCHICGKELSAQTVSQIVDKVLEMPKDTRIMILSPVVRSRKGEYKRLLESIASQGFLRVRVDGKIQEVTQKIELDKNKKHNIEIVVDRLTVNDRYRTRLADSVETALDSSDGNFVIVVNADKNEEVIFSQQYACLNCGVSYQELSPRMFSFNSPYGACPRCGGIGFEWQLDPDLIVPNKNLSIINGAVIPWGEVVGKWIYTQLKSLAKAYDFNLATKFKELPEKIKNIILYGTGDEEFQVNYSDPSRGRSMQYRTSFEGVIPWLNRRYKQTSSVHVRYWIENFMSKRKCPECKGARLKPESLSVLIQGTSIAQVSKMNIAEAHQFFSKLPKNLSERDRYISKQILKEINERLGFLINVGTSYLTLDRQASTLSGGETQRINLATQIGSRLSGVLYVLDEPSIGLHARDNIRLLNTLESLRDLGNTVIIVEHDPETINHADWVLDLGPRAGEKGGYVVAEGPPEKIKENKRSLTGAYLSGKKKIKVPSKRRKGNGKYLVLKGCTGNNLKGIDFKVPLGKFVCVTGVSGSGKSSLVDETLYPALARHYHRSREIPLHYEEIEGLQHLDKIVNVDQSPIGRTPRSNPATYTGVFTPIRDLFASLPDSRVRGYKKGRFSFNVKRGRCNACKGAGVIKLEMHFLPDVYVTCDACRGKRYDRETLQIKYKGKNIYDVLNMTVDTAKEFFKNIPMIRDKLQLISDVGLGYIKLGQPATTLSGGEAQRVKLSLELSKKATGRTLYILDEPTVGLHSDDIKMLLKVLHRLVDKGNTVIVIEHNLDVIKTADWIVDLGPEGGNEGGEIIFQGTPEQIIKFPKSYTGKYLKKVL